MSPAFRAYIGRGWSLPHVLLKRKCFVLCPRHLRADVELGSEASILSCLVRGQPRAFITDRVQFLENRDVAESHAAQNVTGLTETSGAQILYSEIVREVHFEERSAPKCLFYVCSEVNSSSVRSSSACMRKVLTSCTTASKSSVVPR
jgi:hypothetical protein